MKQDLNPFLNKFRILILSIPILVISSCKDKEILPDKTVNPPASIEIFIHIDSLQDRLDNFGNPANIPTNHGTLSPKFNSVSIFKIELLDDSTENFNSGLIIYQSSDRVELHDGDSQLEYFYGNQLPRQFKFIRVYFNDQNYHFDLKYNGNIIDGTLLSFLWPNNYSSSFHIKDSIVNNDSIVHEGKWFLELGSTNNPVLNGEVVPLSNITQPNVLYQEWPVPSSMYVVTCPINPIFSIDKFEHKSFVLSISSNKCFEWVEHSDPAFFEPFDGDTIVDVGIRGLKVIQ
ncbi:MAG: hypothetical protein ABI763_09575 [Bacteroidota bacterium]